MTRLTLLLSVFAAAFSLSSCKSPAFAQPQGDLYAQHGFRFEKARHLTTNYIGKGDFVVAGSKVVMVKVAKSDFLIQLADGRQVEIENIEKFTTLGLKAISERMFAATAPDLSGLSEAELAAVKAGRIEVGMSKKAVLLAVGYPPAHETSISSDSWLYWQSRFNKQRVDFVNDRVSALRN
jgi:hypothetical protein